MPELSWPPAVLSAAGWSNDAAIGQRASPTPGRLLTHYQSHLIQFAIDTRSEQLVIDLLIKCPENRWQVLLGQFDGLSEVRIIGIDFVLPHSPALSTPLKYRDRLMEVVFPDVSTRIDLPIVVAGLDPHRAAFDVIGGNSKRSR